MDEIAKLRGEVEALRAEFAAHIVALKSRVFSHRSWLVACVAALVIGSELGRWGL
jgi:hypothetical protein